MTEEQYEKKVKWTGIFCVIVGILFFIGIILNISKSNYLTALASLGFLVLLILFYVFTKKKKIAGPILGIIFGVMYVLNFNIISILIGVCVIVDCISIFKYLKTNNN